MVSNNRVLAVALSATLVALGARGAFAGSISVGVTPNGGISDISGANLANFITNDVKVSSDVGEQIGAIQIYLNLTSGTVFNHGFGANTPPIAAQFGLVPALEFDTFVASGSGTNVNVPVIAGASADLGSPGTGGPVVFNTTRVDATFGPEAGQPTLNVSDFLVGRFTLSNDANGTFAVAADFSGAGTDPLRQLIIENGIILGQIDPPNTPPVGDAHTLLGVAAGADLALALTATDAEDLANELVYSDFGFVGAPGFGGTGVFNNSPVFNADGSFTWNTLGSARGTYTATATVTDTGGLTGTASYEITITAVPEPATFGLVGVGLVGMVGLIRRRS